MVFSSDNRIGLWLLLGFFALSLIWNGVRLWKLFFGKTVTRAATLLDKYATAYQSADRTGGRSCTQYVLAFDVGGRVEKFEVSVWLYDTIEKGEACQITCRGSRLISID